MIFLSLLLALLLGQIHPLPESSPLHGGPPAWVLSVRRMCDSGSLWGAWITWCVAVLLPVLAVLAMHWVLLCWAGWPLALLWNMALLYLTLGLRQFNDRIDNLIHLKNHAADPIGHAATDIPSALGHATVDAHRQVLGPLAGYVLLAVLGLGPTGAVLHRLAEFVSCQWSQHQSEQPLSAALQRTAARAWATIDWLPARLTALCFAVAGNFDGVVAGLNAQHAPRNSDGVLRAAASGAIGVVGGSSNADSTLHLRSLCRLVWRSVVLWGLLLIALVGAWLLG